MKKAAAKLKIAYMQLKKSKYEEWHNRSGSINAELARVSLGTREHRPKTLKEGQYGILPLSMSILKAYQPMPYYVSCVINGVEMQR